MQTHAEFVSDKTFDSLVIESMDVFGASGIPERSNTIQLNIRSTSTSTSTSLNARNPDESYKLDTLKDTQILAGAIIPSLIHIWIETAPDVFTGLSVTFSPALTILIKILDILDNLTLLHVRMVARVYLMMVCHV